MPTRHQLQSRPTPDSATPICSYMCFYCQSLHPLPPSYLAWTPDPSASTCIHLCDLTLPGSVYSIILNCIHFLFDSSFMTILLYFVLDNHPLPPDSSSVPPLIMSWLLLSRLSDISHYTPRYNSELNLFCLLFPHSPILPTELLTSDL